MFLDLNEEAIIWPGGLTQKPTGLMIPTHLKVLTILEKPFVYARKLGTPLPQPPRQTIGGNLGSFLSGNDNNNNNNPEVASKDVEASFGHARPEDALTINVNKKPFPTDYCDTERGEIECPLYQTGTFLVWFHFFSCCQSSIKSVKVLFLLYSQ